MNDLATAKASFAEQSVIFQRKHNWIMCWLYTGTFGSFIGFSAGLQTPLPGLAAGHPPARVPMHKRVTPPRPGATANPTAPAQPLQRPTPP